MLSARFRKKTPWGLSMAAYLWLAVGMLAMFVTASFAWFSVGSRGRVSEMALYVNAPAGVELSLDYKAAADAWGEHIDLSELISDESVLRPVTWSERDQCFKALRNGTDGRLLSQYRTLYDETNANTTGGAQYYVYCTYYFRTDTAARMRLADAVELNGGQAGAGTYVIGAPVWNEATARHENAGRGAEYAVRIGFRVARIDPNTGENVEDPVFYIYEPNADVHYNGTTQIFNTPSTDGTANLVEPEHLITQTLSTWEEAYPVQRGVTQKSLGTFTENLDLFTITSEQIYRVDMYIWIEGQDVDCYGFSEQAKLAANIQFFADYSEQSGLVEIPDA